ncbi:hypothetical protein NVP1170O_044 [Vibrio phage 1.170.O._10N.261.52.C3]|nr:hypothetical protein NVP1170O_044 [Vibrio phage 1.170.O._10N.261.52.C3]
MKLTKSQKEFIGQKFNHRMGGFYEVIGLSSYQNSTKNKYFDVKCSVCEEINKSRKHHIINGNLCCSCNPKSKRQPKEDFVGTKFTTKMGAELVVKGIVEDSTKNVAVYELECSLCSKDEELYPKGSLLSVKSSLLNGHFPCGCGEGKISMEQEKILAERLIAEKDLPYKVNNVFLEGRRKKRNLSCNVCSRDSELFPEGSIIGSRSDMKRGILFCGCSNVPSWSEDQWGIRVGRVLREKGYQIKNYIDSYHGKDTKFSIYNPLTGNTWDTNYNLIITGRGDPEEAKQRAKESGAFYGYYPNRLDEKDYLYVMDIGGEYIKVGRSFNPNDRLSRVKGNKEAGREDITIISLVTSTHDDIYRMEQEIHEELTQRGFYHHDSLWSTETFDKDSLTITYNLIESYGYEKVTDHPTLVSTYPIATTPD